MTHAATSSHRWVREHRIMAATIGFAAYTAAMLVVEGRIRRTGGPGIVPFELAGTGAKAQEILDRWGPDCEKAARLSMWLDFGYMATYGTLLALLIGRRRRQRGHPSWLPSLAAGAVTADAVEGVSLLRVLDRRDIAVNARRAKVAALTKFAILAVGLGYSI
ncbi:MAG: hypothetical protein P4L86_28140 [Mycobacterium sp.]|nr:hypothetical protein [Mycobacterium sp.]